MSTEVNTIAATSTAVAASPASTEVKNDTAGKMHWTTAVLIVLAGVSATAVIVTNALFIVYDARLSPSDEMYNSYGNRGYRMVVRIVIIIAYVGNLFGLIFDNKFQIENRGTCKAYGFLRIGVATAIACMIVTDPLSEMSWQDVQLRDNVDGSVALAITLSLIALTVLWIFYVRCLRWKTKEYRKAKE